MKEKILTALLNKYKNLGFDANSFDGVAAYLATTVTEESNIETAIAGVEPMLKSFQSEFDRRVSSFRKPEQQQQQQQQNQNAEPQTEIQKAIAEALKPILAEFTQLKSSKTNEVLSAKLISTLNDKKIPAEFYGKAIEGREFKDETEVQTWATELESSYQKFQQTVVNQNLENQGQPAKGDVTKSSKESVQEDIKKLAGSF